MNLTVNQLLTIVGRLDDSPGFDTPRERFRRFLTERMTDAPSARVVVEECRQMSGEQNLRALQDAVVVTGRMLGFATSFSAYQHDPGAAPIAGQWESRRRLRVILALCAGQMAESEVEALSNEVRSRGQADISRVGLCVVTPFCSAKARLEEMLQTRMHPELRLISLAGILRMADMTAAGRLTHDDVLQLLNPDVTVDSVVDLLDRSRTAAHTSSELDPVDSSRTAAHTSAELDLVDRSRNVADRPSEPAPADQRAPEGERAAAGNFWIAAIRLPQDTPAAQFVDSVISNRRLLAIHPASQAQRDVKPGDSICVCIAGEGFVADARVAGLVEDGTSGVRNAERFAQVLRLTDVTVYGVPVVPAPELIRKIELTPNGDAGAVVTPVSRGEFARVTRAAVRSRNS